MLEPLGALTVLLHPPALHVCENGGVLLQEELPKLTICFRCYVRRVLLVNMMQSSPPPFSRVKSVLPRSAAAEALEPTALRIV